MILKVDGKRNSLSCKLKAGVECSPSVGPCCTDQCSFIPQSHKEKCKEEQVSNLHFYGLLKHLPVLILNFKDCTEVSFCNGRTALCPPADTKSDNVTECNGGTQVSYQLFCILYVNHCNASSRLFTSKISNEKLARCASRVTAREASA